ncbi:hypothetical protein O7623_08890 [Solwaraspora sp. WMMD791]|uniref:hypothetical protein n=1 Tax=Solwaraspora sp. WMMD791 TaxID=3016086 RepID=UPI00249C0632|nr:hypothetical protein [Solwaraspora sp. WMMD791]WFE29286.1 hypothetical protein O7623_08890 [Solwaraspora sp. WMMD791]
MPPQPPGVRRLCVVVDIEGYTRRLHPQQIDVQRRLLLVVRRACADAGIDLSRSGRQDRGDGLLIVLPAGIDESKVVPGFLHCLNEALYDANDRPGPGGRIRLRAALSQGIVHVAATGYAGDAVVHACRLLDSAVLRTALVEHQNSDLALIVDDTLFHSIVEQEYGGLYARSFRPVEVVIEEKQFQASAWIQVPGRPPHAAGRRSRLDDPAAPDVDFGTVLAIGGAAIGSAAVGALAAITAAELLDLLDDTAGYDYSDHDSTGYDYADHDPTGYDVHDHDPAGHDPAGHDATGHEPVGGHRALEADTTSSWNGDDGDHHHSVDHGYGMSGSDPT